MKQYPPEHKAPVPWNVDLVVTAPITFRVMAVGPGDAKRAALRAARHLAAEASATVVLSQETESTVDEKCDWKFGAPNGKNIPAPRLAGKR